MIATELDVNAARLAHLRWEAALEATVNGEGTQEPLMGHEDCDLGTWIYGTGLSRYGKLGAVWQLKTVHKRFHHLAEETLSACAAGKAERAVEKLAAVRKLSGEILFLLTSLELDVIEAAISRAQPNDIPSRLTRALFPKPLPLNIISIQALGEADSGRHTLNVTGARLVHLKWIRDLQSAFRGHGKAMRAQPSDECSLGIWIHGTAMRELGATEALKSLDAVHKRFHREVDLVISSLNHGKLRTADEAYEEALVLSGEIITLLTRLQVELADSQVLSAGSSKL
ncbi:CZB domain-containing protein [Paramagnetospirillum magnetotacticum]|uniref:CZB domain-containing protein n=1 Tax=Paramagnetospirillum magnetotacticum TaxID=188 RepID=UPI000596FEC2|nr:CZB domain-containing protein [Paramagnetospirillum magnetotacticum]